MHKINIGGGGGGGGGIILCWPTLPNSLNATSVILLCNHNQEVAIDSLNFNAEG